MTRAIDTPTWQELIEAANGKFYYLASPYSHVDPKVREERAFGVMKAAGRLLAEGLFAFSPIWHCHHCAMANDLDPNYKWWIDYNDSFIRPSAGIIIVMLPGWADSRGIQFEIKRALDWNLPLYAYDWGAHKVHAFSK